MQKKVKATVVGKFNFKYDSLYAATRDEGYITERLKECGGIKTVQGRKGNFTIKVIRKGGNK